MNEFRLSTEAERNLDEIFDYIARDNPAAASRFVQLIKGKFRLLAEFPRMGRSRPEFGTRTRSFVVRKYTIFYRVIKEGVLITHIYHGARDLFALFGKNK